MKKLLIALMLLLFAVPAMGATLTFTWMANTEPDLAGYILVENGVILHIIDKADTTYQMESNEGLRVYYLAAFDYTGNVSDPSEPAIYGEGSVIGGGDSTAPTKINFTLTVQ